MHDDSNNIPCSCLFKQENITQSSVKAGLISGQLSEIEISAEKSSITSITVYAVPNSIASMSNSVSEIYPHSKVSEDGSFTITGVPIGNTILLIDINNDGISDERLVNIQVTAGETVSAGIISYLDSAENSDLWFKPEIQNSSIANNSILSIAINGYNGSGKNRKIGYRIFLYDSGELFLKEDSFSKSEYIEIPSKSGTDDASILTSQFDSTLPGTSHLNSSYYVLKTIFGDGSYAGGTCKFNISGFTTPKIDLLTPNGGNGIDEGVNITWSSFDYQGKTLLVDIFFSRFGTDSWTSIASNEVDDEEYYWNTASISPGEYIVKIVVKNTSLGYQNEDSSDNTFRILHPPLQKDLSHGLIPVIQKPRVKQPGNSTAQRCKW